MHRRRVLGLGAAALTAVLLPARAQVASDPRSVLTNWYKLSLQLVRHTATYSPPVASRAFGYLGVTGYEAVAACDEGMTSLAGQLNGLTTLPRAGDGVHDAAAVLQAALSATVAHFFSNTGPSGQRALATMTRKLDAQVAQGLAPEVLRQSVGLGQAIAAHIIDWADVDGGAVVENMGFAQSYRPPADPSAWVPTSLIRQQQAPLLPDWGRVRPFAMPAGNTCALPPPPVYSEDPTSDFYAEAMEVYTATKALTDEQALIARFWSDDPMLSSTPPGHWIFVANDLISRHNLPLTVSVDMMARLGIGMADAFIGCWHDKTEYNLLRPVTYINRVIDKDWKPLLITPPFAEYPSGHSTVSAAAATVLTGVLGEAFAYEDFTHEREGLDARSYASFWQAADEAGISRLYGGIHFRSAIEQGMEQGRCIGAHAVSLRTLA
ncbi:MAG: vanadium-dependent haloperoxidase [Pseudotabrizicola sp.]|uniref:vanadium-dependent haloperoxidase n=1 Tax=Pseudotabrizicola sp. TaxID=2939647 RepID=UPI002717F18C|nr:vanadium-dependent haloperoxidase [Pseudotabrizicola sp.]MDO8883661.1 vanadium-dependent haloperoxidase [Pseudotabrizicola sp.]MDP2081818.1 vanadium-dependent haloperoxidase [Pseudotabrizicola sp.]MDZ7573892.1 vanadium-dependent haloperoxidase [Pseudotabrizicola sp.]